MNRTNISTGGPYEATNGYSRCVKIEHRPDVARLRLQLSAAHT